METQIFLYSVYEVELDLELDNIVFTSPGGKQYIVNTFMKSNGKLSARCYIDEVGTWSYTLGETVINIFCTRPSLKLHGKIKACGKNNRKLMYEDSTPYYMIGFECDWLFHIDDKDEQIPKATVLLNDIAQNKFNMVICNLWANDVKWKETGGRGTCYDFSNPFETPYQRNLDGTMNYDELNLKFFDRVDKIFNLANELNIVIHLMIYVWNKLVPWPKLFSEQDNAMFKHVIDRYAAYPNLIWDISKEALNSASVEQIKKKCNIARELDPFGTMLTVHDDMFCKQNPYVINMHSIQCWDYGIHEIMLEIYNNAKPNPLLNIEHGGYERGVYDVFMGSYDDPYICLERNYIIAFAGAYTSYYWQNAAWSIVIWNYQELLPSVRPNYHYYRNLYNYMEYMNYENAYPAPAHSPCQMCMDDGNYYYYLKLRGTRCVTLNNKNEHIDAQTLEWYNPLTNEFAHTYTEEFKGYHAMPCPFNQEFSILRIKHN